LEFTTGSYGSSNDSSNSSSIHCSCDLTGRWYLGVGEETPEVQSFDFQVLLITGRLCSTSL